MEGVDVSKKSTSVMKEHQLSFCADDFIQINVCGMMYETFKTTVEKYPDTLLGNVERRQRYFVDFKNAYFFDRNRECFESVLYFYQSGGCLIRPAQVSMKLFADEVRFFGIPEAKLLQLQIMEGYVQCDEDQNNLPRRRWQRNIWLIMEHPDSSLFARVVGCFSILVIVISIITFCLESVPAYNNIERDEHLSSNNSNNSTLHSSVYCYASCKQTIDIIELIAITWFTLEYLIRFISSPNKWKFLKSFLNLIDLAAILPYYVILAIEKQAPSIAVIRVARLVRVFRVFKLSRHSMGLQTLGNTLKASISELGMLVFIMFFSMLIFSSAMYYVEHDDNQDVFPSIPGTFWYTVVTMTTVGYGDRVPVTVAGKFIGSVCAVSGVLTIAMVVPIIITNFEFFYKRDLLNMTQQHQQQDTERKRVSYDKDL